MISPSNPLPKYPSYYEPESGWIGELPSGWDVLRGKFVFSEFQERSETGDELLLSVSEYYGVKPRQDAIDDEEFLTRAETLVGYKKVGINDLAMNIMLAWKKGLGVSKYSGIVSPSYSVFRFGRKADPDFMHYLLRTDLYADYFKARSTGIMDSRLRLYPDSFRDIQIVLPPSEQQKQIVAFLNYETAKIDALIEKQQQLLALLGEKRQAVISHAVTKGLNRDAPMRDSGVEWLGKVPVHWKIKKLGHLGRVQNGLNIGAEAFGSGAPFVSYGDVYNNLNVPESPSGLVQSTREDRVKCSLLTGDVLFTRTSESVDDIGIAATCLCDIPNSTFAGFLIRFRPTPGTFAAHYSTYLFRNQGVKLHFAGTMNLVTRASLSQDVLKKLPVCVPPLGEQVQIAKKLARSREVFNDLEGKLIGQRELLAERRTALISAAVTGKIDVRGWKRPYSDT